MRRRWSSFSQSGETADSLAALREAKERKSRVLGIVNVVGSSIAREADNVFYTWAGPEISVATTKAYSTQLIALYLLAMKFSKVRGTVGEAEFAAMLEDLRRLPKQVEFLLGGQERIQKFANRYLAADHIFFIGRGLDYAISLQEVRTRGAFVMAVTNAHHTDAEKNADYVIYLPETNSYFTNSLAVIPLQLFGYYVALGRGLDVDKPRNLAKSVTVE